MVLADCFNAEDRVQVKFSTFYELVKAVLREIRCLTLLTVMSLIDTLERW